MQICENEHENLTLLLHYIIFTFIHMTHVLFKLPI